MYEELKTAVVKIAAAAAAGSEVPFEYCRVEWKLDLVVRTLHGISVFLEEYNSETSTENDRFVQQ